MSWIEPKTDWTQNDSFDATAFNRISGNLNVLGNMANKIFPRTDFKTLQENKTYSDFVYADEMNDIEDKLHDINSASFNYNIGTKQSYVANKETPLDAEFNRIESASLQLHDELQDDINILPRLKIRLGNAKGVKI